MVEEPQYLTQSKSKKVMNNHRILPLEPSLFLFYLGEGE